MLSLTDIQCLQCSGYFSLTDNIPRMNRQSSVVPKLNLRRATVNSNSAPNSARSNKSEPSVKKSQAPTKDDKFLAWRRRKEYRPTSATLGRSGMMMMMVVAVLTIF